MEREYVLRALRASNWVIGGPNGAAARLGIKRTTLVYRVRKLKIPLRPELTKAVICKPHVHGLVRSCRAIPRLLLIFERDHCAVCPIGQLVLRLSVVELGLQRERLGFEPLRAAASAWDGR